MSHEITRRWAGPLTPAEIRIARANGTPLAYDPAQLGWVYCDARDADDDPPRAPSFRQPGGDLTQLGGIRLRPWRLDDLSVFRALLDDPEVWRFMYEPYPAPLTEDMARQLLQLSGVERHHKVRAAEFGGEVIGQTRILFDGPDTGPNEAEISFWMGRQHWRRGLGTNMVRLATLRGFARHPSLKRLVAYVHPDNRGSLRVLEKAGYVPNGTRADHWHRLVRARP
ncbi:GNAT family N-acetyltransferase [Paracoccus salsus]|uniref:GNAT family N-acetyltransferase n=1 Tax=Paracoccus salsus TaxID=2911061 RepID=UPI001F2DFADA|nr:GNAT family protein [Paracoccus salsus]MCF3974123.1 GNAT family N-acetyltransferase [Paracoccus salsus]